MADDSEERPRTYHDFASAKAAIFETFREMNKQREAKLEEFKNKQYFEQERLLQESQKQFGVFIGSTNFSSSEDKTKRIIPEISDISLTSLANDLDSHDTLQESSITGHLQRCFNDSSPSNVSLCENKVPSVPEKIPVFSELRSSQFSEKNHSEKENQSASVVNGLSKPKRPFLRKGSGLLRYMPKSRPNGPETKKKELPKNNHQVKNFQLPQKTLKLKPAIRKTVTPSENVKHIRFDIIESDNSVDDEDLTEEASSPISKISGDTDAQNKSSSLSPSSAEHSFSETNKFEDVSVSESGSLNLLKEKEELKEFEMLENIAQNTSFNSDSSVVQRVLHGEPLKAYSRQNYGTKLTSMSSVVTASNEMHKQPPKKSNILEKIGLNQHIEEIQARKQNIQKTISDIEPQILSLQKEISCSQKNVLDDITDRCSTPVQDLDISSSSPECKSENGSSEFETSAALHGVSVDDLENTNCQSDCKCGHADGVLKNLHHNAVENSSSEEEDFTSGVPEKSQEKVFCEKSKVLEKILELEKEIETYQQLNSKLASVYKEKDEILKKLQRERENFNKYKEEEKKKLEAEIQEERKQMKRQKESFKRYQELRKDNPTKKEREELNALRQEIESLQEELKRQKIKYNNDSRRWKNRLDAAERERDTFKLENIKLSEQCEDLITALKTRIKKNSDLRSLDNISGHIVDQGDKQASMKDAQTQTETKEQDFNISQDQSAVNSRKAKSKVNFDITPDWRKNMFEGIPDGTSIYTKDSSDINNLPKEHGDVIDNNAVTNIEKDSVDANLSVVSVSVEEQIKQINHGNKKEKIYPSGEREIIFNSGTRKIISADGKSTKFLFYNGDVKEIFYDGRQMYRYVNGVIETQYPDGVKLTEFPNGQTQRRFPDGQKEVKFPDGTIHNIYVDGSEEIRCTNGKVVSVNADGTKVIQLPNGQKEIRAATYTRREFPDGSVKIVYESGKQETRYPDGRIRIKNEKGKVCLDTKYDIILKG